ncbi:MAG: hypothetical protein NKF70_03745 [Methanobacterium sp. ERen5]|nr:MAG: hypothetical protein NKF70_03745 [Methanobacterium sp. ERen5]
MLTKMPSETKSKTEPSQLNTKFFVGVVAVFAVLGIAGGYMMFPLLQTPNVATVTVNTTNNTTNYTSPVVKHSTIVSNKSGESSQNNNGSMESKTTNKSTSKQTYHNVGNGGTGRNAT